MVRLSESSLFAGDGLGREVRVPIRADEETRTLWAFRFSDIIGKSPYIAFSLRKIKKNVTFSAANDPASRFGGAFSLSAGLLFHGSSLFQKNALVYTEGTTYARAYI